MRKVAMTEQIKQQILQVRDTALTNMFDIEQVHYIAENMVKQELVDFLEDRTKEYVQFILTGQA